MKFIAKDGMRRLVITQPVGGGFFINIVGPLGSWAEFYINHKDAIRLKKRMTDPETKGRK